MRHVDELKRNLQLAHQIVENETEPYKIEAFKIVLNNLMQVNLDNINIHSPKPISKKIQDGSTVDDNMETLAQNCNIGVKELRDVLFVDDDVVHLIKPLQGTESEKQIIAAQCILTTYDVVFAREWVDSSLLMKCIKMSSVGGLDHLARNLRNNEFFRIRGQGKGKSLEYKISNYGKNDSFEKIKNLIKGDHA